MKTRKVALIGAVLLAVMVAVLGPMSCSPGEQQGEKLVVYTAMEIDELNVYKKAWAAKHPDIPLKIVRDSTGIMTAKLLAEKDNPKADVVWALAATSLLLCDEAGMIKGYNPKGLDRVKENFRDVKHSEARWVGIKAWMCGFTSNTIECKNLGLEYPKSYEDLIKPEYKGRLVMPNPASSGTGFLFVSSILQLKGEDEGWAYLDKLHENMAQYTHSGSKPSKLAGKGEYPIGISFAFRALKQKAKGERVVLTLPSEGSGWDVEANALIRKPKIKEEAKLFLDWAINDDMMKMYSRFWPTTSVPVESELELKGWPTNVSTQLIKNDFYWAARNRIRILKEWSRRYEGKSATKN